MQGFSSHAFAICAYKESPYLEACIQSLKGQSHRSELLISTSTPNAHIQGLAQKYGIPLYVNPGPSGIANDWNFACSQAKTDLVTVAHQDDIYERDYAQTVIEAANSAKRPLLVHTDYYEIRGDAVVTRNRLLRIKRLMNAPMRLRPLQSSRLARRAILSFGNPVCCPSITFVRPNIAREPLFDTRFRNSCDYQTLIEIMRLRGSFVYCPELLMGHRIHAESATTQNIHERVRYQEDLSILSSLWPTWIAKAVMRVYSKSEQSNA